MQGLNKLQLIGNVGNDPELSYTQGGTALLKVRLAVNERRKIRDEWTDVTEWFSVIVWSKRAEGLAKVLSKGAPVMVEGPMRHRSFEGRDGGKRDVYEVHADNVLLLGGARQVQSSQDTSSQDKSPPAASEQADDDDIPF